MASFHAELHVEGHTYSVWFCDCTFHQATDERGRVSARVRHGPLHLTVDVPEHAALLAWAVAPHKPLPGQVVFYDTAHYVPLESIAFDAGECVAYRERFASAATGAGAYRAQLTITAPAFELRAGGPAAALGNAGATVLRKVAAVAPVVKKLAAAIAAPAAALRAVVPPAPAFVPEYTLAEFTATVKGAQHLKPLETIEQLYHLFNTASAASAPGKPSLVDWKALETLLCSSYYEDPDDGNKVKKLNDHWPPANGGYQRQVVQLKAGDTFDRYQGSIFNKKDDPITGNPIDHEIGDEFKVTFGGNFVSPMGRAGTPIVPQSFESRALDRLEDKFPFKYTITILKDIPLDAVSAELSQVIPWFGQPGGGTQARILFPTVLKGDTWSRKEWQQMQRKKFAKVELESSPNGQFEILPKNKVRQLKDNPKKP